MKTTKTQLLPQSTEAAFKASIHNLGFQSIGCLYFLVVNCHVMLQSIRNQVFPHKCNITGQKWPKEDKSGHARASAQDQSGGMLHAVGPLCHVAVPVASGPAHAPHAACTGPAPALFMAVHGMHTWPRA